MSGNLHMPILLQPVYKEYIWGGRRLATECGRALLPGIYAESWEIADHPDGETLIVNGPAAGMTLSEALRVFGEEISGSGGAGETRFPLMVKIIDAKETLSVQVHPDDEEAARWGGEAKSEMWVVLEATPDAHIYSGFLPGVTEADFEKARAEGTIPNLLQRYPARPGMVFYTPGGRVHAIGAGCLLLEVQQNSNTTYRLWDWDRVGKDGNPRPLHVEKGLQVIRWGLTESPVAAIQSERAVEGQPATVREILDTPYFRVGEWTLRGNCRMEEDGSSFTILFPTDGDVRVKTPGQPAMILPQRATCLMPAAIREFEVQPEGESVRLLAIRRA